MDGPASLTCLPLVVDERPDPAPGRTGDERVADLEGAALHEDRGHRAAADVEVRLEHDALGPAVGVGPEVLDVGDERAAFSSRSSMPRPWRAETSTMIGVAAPRLRDEALLGELLHAPGRGWPSRGRSC